MTKFWNWLNGKKTSVAAAYWFTVEVLVPVVFTDGLSADATKAKLMIGAILTALGLGHKAVKGIIAKK